MYSPYQRPDPYPVPTDLKKNLYYAKILLNSFSGRVSEMTAVTQYIYHHLEAEQIAEEVGSCLRGIAIVEMHHLDMLGGCIRQLGMQPRYRSVQANRFSYWNAGYVCYGNSLRTMLEIDLQGEQDAIAHYHSIIQAVREPQIRLMIERIIADEELHIEKLQELLQHL